MNLEWLGSLAQSILAIGVNGIWGGLFFLAVAYLSVRLLSLKTPLNASTRYTVWVAAMLACVGVMIWQGLRGDANFLAEEAPVEVSSMVPAAQIDLHKTRNWEKSTSWLEPGLYNSAESLEPAPAAPVPAASPAVEEMTPVPVVPPAPIATTVEQRNPLPTMASESPDDAMLAPRVEWLAIPASWSMILVALWASISGILLIRLFHGLHQVRRLKRRATPAPEAIQSLTNRWVCTLQGGRFVRVGISEDLNTAVAIGYMHPLILLPAVIFESVTDEEVEHVVLHELAHLQRYDDWTILLQQVLGAILFFHPALWVLGRYMNHDRELACDDWVVALTRKPKTYARCLAKIATLQAEGTPPRYTPQATAGKAQLFERVKAILNGQRQVSFRISYIAFLAILSVSVLTLLGLLHVAPVIAVPENMEQQVPVAEQVEVAPEEEQGDIAEEGVDLWMPEASVEVTLAKNEETATAFTADETAQLTMQQTLQEAGQQVTRQTTLVAEDVATSAAIALGDEALVEQTNERVAVLSSGESNLEFTTPEAVATPLPEIAPGPEQTPEPILATEPIAQQDEPLSKVSMLRWIRAASTISSPGDKANLLIQSSRKLHQDNQVLKAYIRAAESVSSPSDRRRTLMALIDHHTLEGEPAIEFLNATARISSPAEKAKVLLATLEGNAVDVSNQDTMDRLKEVVQSMASYSEYSRVARELIQKERALRTSY